MNQITPVVKQLLIINILFFIGIIALGLDSNDNVAYKTLSLYYPENPMFRFWQPLTHMFMHGGVGHIFFNMFALVSFGSTLEHFWGGKRFLIFYLICGLGAGLVSVVVNYYFVHHAIDTLVLNGINQSEVLKTLFENKPTSSWQSILTPSSYSNLVSNYFVSSVGASGAIYGLLIAFAFMFPDAKLGLMFIPVPIAAKYFVPAIVLLDLFSGVTGYSIFGQNIGHFAHVGGALFGLIMMLIWRNKKFNFNRIN